MSALRSSIRLKTNPIKRYAIINNARCPQWCQRRLVPYLAPSFHPIYPASWLAGTAYPR
jgi:hypothetical protein